MSQAARNLPDAWSSGRAKPREQVLLEHIVPQNYNIYWTTHEKFALEQIIDAHQRLNQILNVVLSSRWANQHNCYCLYGLLICKRIRDRTAGSTTSNHNHIRRRAISRRRGTRLESSNQLYGWRTLARKQKPFNSTRWLWCDFIPSNRNQYLKNNGFQTSTASFFFFGSCTRNLLFHLNEIRVY